MTIAYVNPDSIVIKTATRLASQYPNEDLVSCTSYNCLTNNSDERLSIVSHAHQGGFDNWQPDLFVDYLINNCGLDLSKNKNN